MIASMNRIEIVFMRDELSAIVAFLQEAGVVHLEQVPLAVENHPGYLHRVHLPKAERKEAEALTQLDQQLREVLPLLSVKPSHAQIVEAGRLVESTGRALAEGAALKHAHDVRQVHRELRRLSRRRLNLQDDIALIQSYSKLLSEVMPLVQESGARLGGNARVLILDAFTQENLDALKKRLAGAGGFSTQFVTRRLGKDRDALVVVTPAESAEAIDAAIAKEGLRTLSAPDGENYGDSSYAVMTHAGKKLVALQGQLTQIVEEIRVSSEKYGAKLTAISQIVNARLQQLNVTDNFAQSRLVGVAHGWVPTADYPRLQAALKERFGSRAAIGTLGLHDVELERVPTKRENHPLVQPFELIMGMMKPPSYGHFDPTWLVALSFIVFYGFVLGDMGYGLILLGIGALVKKKYGHIKMLHQGMSILQCMGVSAIIFGFIYWEFIGNTLEKLVGFPDFLFHRAHETTTLLMLSVMFGVVHIPLSLIIGVREGYAHGHTKHAQEKLGMLLGLIALFVGLASSAGYFPLGATLGSILALGLVGAAMYYLVKGMGAMSPMGVMEIIGLSANILSYSRLMALGIAGIAFADIANGMPQSATSFLVFLLGLVGAFFVHAFNLGLSVFSPTIHSVRLNFVEFLPKFYHPEGRNYEPFRKDMAW